MSLRNERALLWGYLALITLAELVTALVSAQIGQLILIVLLCGLLLHSALGPQGPVSRLALALALAPLIRILSISLPLRILPQLAWYPLVSLPLLITTWLLIRQLGLGRAEIGLRWGNLALQLGLMSVGVLLGAGEYFILAPRPQFAEPTASAFALATLNLLVFTGFTEELIFRGVLQTLGGPALGRWGLLYVSLLFGVLHIGYLSVLDVVFVTGVGLLFAYVAHWTGSLLGVTLIHGMTNTMLFLVMPQIVAVPGMQQNPWVLAGLSVSTASAVVALTSMVGLQLFPKTAEDRRPVQTLMREARQRERLTYAALSQRTGLSIRVLAEIEHGLRPLQPDELDRIAQSLGLAPSQFAHEPGFGPLRPHVGAGEGGPALSTAEG